MEASVPLRTKGTEAGLWDFRGKAGDSQADEKEQTSKQMVAGAPETKGVSQTSRRCLLCLSLLC